MAFKRRYLLSAEFFNLYLLVGVLGPHIFHIFGLILNILNSLNILDLLVRLLLMGGGEGGLLGADDEALAPQGLLPQGGGQGDNVTVDLFLLKLYPFVKY